MSNPMPACGGDGEAREKKGLREGGPCNRTACQKPGARWWNTSTRAWYCDDCARAINNACRPDPVPLLVTRASLPALPPSPSAVGAGEATRDVSVANGVSVADGGLRFPGGDWFALDGNVLRTWAEVARSQPLSAVYFLERLADAMDAGALALAGSPPPVLAGRVPEEVRADGALADAKADRNAAIEHAMAVTAAAHRLYTVMPTEVWHLPQAQALASLLWPRIHGPRDGA